MKATVVKMLYQVIIMINLWFMWLSV